jgi:hypothetical protein
LCGHCLCRSNAGADWSVSFVTSLEGRRRQGDVLVVADAHFQTNKQPLAISQRPESKSRILPILACESRSLSLRHTVADATPRCAAPSPASALGHVLERAAGAVRQREQHAQAVGCGQWCPATHLSGAFGSGPVGGVIARRAAGAVGCSDGTTRVWNVVIGAALVSYLATPAGDWLAVRDPECNL